MGFPRLWRPHCTAAAVFLQVSASTHLALASQGPGGAPGTAGPVTQLAMAIVVYGSCAAILAAGLIGSFKKRS
jgi:hypothetical protein